MTWHTFVICLLVAFLFVFCVVMLRSQLGNLRWRKFCNAVGGEKAALKIIDRINEDTDAKLRDGFKELERRKARVLQFPRITNKGQPVNFEDGAA